MAGANEERAAGTRRNRRSEAGPAAGRASRPMDTNSKGVQGRGQLGAGLRPPLVQRRRIALPPRSRLAAGGAPGSGGSERDLLFLCPAVRVAVWDAVAAYVREQLVAHKVRWPAVPPLPVRPGLPLRLPLHTQRETPPALLSWASHGLPADARSLVPGAVGSRGRCHSLEASGSREAASTPPAVPHLGGRGAGERRAALPKAVPTPRLVPLSGGRGS